MSVVKYQLVIYVKFSYSKGFYGAGLVIFTLQLLVYLFSYVIESVSLAEYLVENWAGCLGYMMLVVIFIYKKIPGSDIILTIIGMLLWAVQFYQVFMIKGPLLGFITSGLGMLGIALSFVGFVFEVKEMRSK